MFNSEMSFLVKCPAHVNHDFFKISKFQARGSEWRNKN